MPNAEVPAPELAVAVIPGASRPEHIAEDHAALAAEIPADFWTEIREQGLVSPDAPLPVDKLAD